MRKADTFSLDPVATVRENAQQQVGDLVVEEVNFIHVENPSVRLGEQSRLKHRFPLLHRLFHIHGTEQSIFRDVEGNLDEGGANNLGGKFRDAAVDRATVEFEGSIVPFFGFLRIAVTQGIREDFDGGEKRVQRPRHNRFRRSPLPGDRHSTQSRIDGSEQQGQFNRILSDNGCQGKAGLSRGENRR